MLMQQIFSDFSTGLNDTISAISIKDSEVALSENVTYSAEVKGFQTRKGCDKVNADSFSANVTDGYSWTVGSKYKKCVVKNGAVYDLDLNTGTLVKKIDLTTGSTRIYPFVIYDRLYFGDGSELYVWGDFTFSSEQGTAIVLKGDVVRNNNSDKGVKGNFYQAKKDLGSIDLKTQDYTVSDNWENVTEVKYFASNVVTKVKPYDPSKKETVEIAISRGCENTGTLSFVLNNATFTCSVSQGDSVPTVVDKIMAVTTTAWTKTKNGNAVTFVKDIAGVCDNGYLDPSSTGIVATYTAKVEGKANDNDLAPIKKCTMFMVHPNSMRVFAAGNPDDNALYYSEKGLPTYFSSAISKVYPSNGYGRLTALGTISGSLIVSYENGWYSWDGITPLQDATWTPLNLPYGCVCHDTLALTPYSFTYLGKDGIYTVSASILSREMILIQGKDVIRKITENRVEKVIASIKDRKMCRGIFYESVYYLAYNTDGIENDKVLKYEWNTKSFALSTGNIINQWIVDPENLYFTTKNYVLETNTGYSDFDVDTGKKKPINVRVKTKEYPLGSPMSNKAVQMVGIIFKQNEAPEANADINIIMGYDSYSVKGADLAESLVYGRNWGLIWGYREAIIKTIELSMISNTFQIEITNSNLDDPLTIIGIGFVYEDIGINAPNIMKDEVLLK